MAKFIGATTKELQEQFEKMNVNLEEMLSQMVTAGAQVVHDNMVAKMPENLKRV